MKSKILLAIIFALSLIPCLAQTQKSRKQKSNKSNLVKMNLPSALSDEEKRDQKEWERVKKEARYYAPIRYVIVYNWIFDKLELPERRMDILMDAKQFNEKNLIKIFELIKKRFPNPLDLMINVHTSLATIETPEENEMTKDSQDSRFGHTYTKYKRAGYNRFENGREAFTYTTKILPYYDEKLVVLKDIKFR